MSLAGRYFRLKPADRGLVRRACWRLVVARFQLRVVSFERLIERVATNPEIESAGEEARRGVERVCWAVEAAASRLPGMDNCLVKALAAGFMLRQRRLPGALRLGAARGESEGLNAHAWIEFEGRALVGGPDVSRYEPLTGRVNSISRP